MENYKLKQRLGKGAQGAVFIAEERETQHQYVLKKVECNDQSEATKAFKEAMALQNLKHKHTCGYKEFFVTWDKEESAMCVCIVMEYYRMGDLDHALKLKRAKLEPIEELTMKKWFGQMLDALVFVHDKKIIHRDLKPSNIFLTDTLDVSIGDFGVATIMDDARTRSRTTVGTMNWMAPEVLEKPAYDERSDIWSLGCILLEIATCGCMDSAEISGELFQIKNSPDCLENILQKVAQQYNNLDLCQVIRIMLRINFQQRPTARQLCELPYVQECLVLCKSDLALANTKKASNSGEKHLPVDKGIGGVVAFMKENNDHTECEVEALEYLVKYTQNQDVECDDDCKLTVAAIMKDHVSALRVQELGCKFFLNLIPVCGEGDTLFSKEIISPILLAMRSHGKSAELQTSACQLLMAFSADEYVSEAIGKLGGLQDILADMRAFRDNPEIAACSCSAIWSICVNEQNCKIISEEQGLKDINEALMTHSENADVIEAACAAIWSLSMEDNVVTMMEDLEVELTLVDMISRHIKRPKVVKNAVMALASMVEEREHFAYNLSNNNSIETIIKAYQEHKDNEEVVENICTFFVEMSEYDDIREEMKALKVADILTEAKNKYKANKDVCDAASTVQVALQAGGGSQHSMRTPSSVSKKDRVSSARCQSGRTN